MARTSQPPMILTLNSGSSSLKFGVYRFDDATPAEGDGGGDGDAGIDKRHLLVEGSATGIGTPNGALRIRSSDGRVDVHIDHLAESQTDALKKIGAVLHEHGYGTPDAVGHRIVHGGPNLTTHQRLTDDVRRHLHDAVHFAPLHIPAALALIDKATTIFDKAEHFVCFDTAFHQTMPPRAATLPIPARYAAHGVRRYGFHGLSYESLVSRLGAALPERMVFAHLGNGSSLCAVHEGKSIDTSMGLTPTGGIPMSTRSGDLDPGVLLYMMRADQQDADGLEKMLNRDSGLRGLMSHDGHDGGAGDMQVLLEKSIEGDQDAALAVDVFVTSIRKQIGAYAALMGGLDCIVFTGGIGEHSAEIRKRICSGLAFMGVVVDGGEDADDKTAVNAGASAVPGKVHVMNAAEEWQIAVHCHDLYRA